MLSMWKQTYKHAGRLAQFFFWGALSVASYAEPSLVVDEQAASGGTAGYGSTTDIVIGLH